MIFHPRLKSLFRYVEGELDEKMSRKVAGHLDKCSSCQKKVDALMDIDFTLKPEKNIPDSAEKKLLSNLPDIKFVSRPFFGEIAGVVGSVTVLRDDRDEEPAFKEMGLLKGDVLKTGSDGLALVLLNDGSEIYVNKDSEAKIGSKDAEINMPVGKLFSMMKPQAEKFRIKTPAAVVEVLGTDFETEATPDFRTILRVLKGSVSYKNNAGKITVNKKHKVEANKTTLPLATNLKDTAGVIDWIKPVKQTKKQGGLTMKHFVTTTAFLIVMMTGIFYLSLQIGQDNNYPISEGVQDKSGIALNETKQLANTISLKPVFKQQGKKWETHIEENAFIKNEWMEILKIDLKSEVVSFSDADGARILVSVEDYWLGEGIPNPERIDEIVGSSFYYHYSPEGNLKSFDVIGKEKIPPFLVEISEMGIHANSIISVIKKENISEGDKWEAGYDIKMPGYDESVMKTQSTVEFTGFEIIENQKTAVFKKWTEIFRGGYFSNEINTPKLRTASYLKSMEKTSESTLYMDVENREIYKIVTQSVLGKIRSVTHVYAAGRKKPVTEEIERDSNLATRMTISIKY